MEKSALETDLRTLIKKAKKKTCPNFSGALQFREFSQQRGINTGVDSLTQSTHRVAKGEIFGKFTQSLRLRPILHLGNDFCRGENRTWQTVGAETG